MQASNSFKRGFLKKLLMGFQVGDFSSRNMTLLERKRAIKLSADIALASAREGRIWSRAIISNVLKEEKNSTLVRGILGKGFDSLTTKTCLGSFMCKRVRSKKIVRSSKVHRIIRKSSSPQRMVASAIAKRMVKKRTKKLKSIVPGGNSLDGLSLLDETVDYIIYLKAQVDVMRRLTNSVQCLNHNAV